MTGDEHPDLVPTTEGPPEPNAEPSGTMWPTQNSGFEANQFSPAGEIQQVGALASGLKRKGSLGRAVRMNWFTRVMAAIIGVLVVGAVIAAIVSALS